MLCPSYYVNFIKKSKVLMGKCELAPSDLPFEASEASWNLATRR